MSKREKEEVGEVGRGWVEEGVKGGEGFALPYRSNNDDLRS